MLSLKKKSCKLFVLRRLEHFIGNLTTKYSLQNMAPQVNKVTDLIIKSTQKKISVSFEVTPDVTEVDIHDLEVEPAFFSVTWHAKSHQCKSLNIGPIKTGTLLKGKNKEVLLHLSCDILRKNYLDEVMSKLQENGICNLFVVLGEGFDPDTTDFKNSLELIRYIREKTGNYFCIGIPGLPDSTEEKLLQMKDKIESGANFIMTQAFFDPAIFKNYLERCQKLGINVPIIPGIFLFENFNQLNNFINLCKIKVSNDILERVKNSEESDLVCVEVVKNIISVLSTQLNISHFHFFTLNKLKSVSSFIKQL